MKQSTQRFVAALSVGALAASVTVLAQQASRPLGALIVPAGFKSGTTKLHGLEESLGAVEVQLTADDLREIEEAAAKIPVKGERLPEAVLKLSNG